MEYKKLTTRQWKLYDLLTNEKNIEHWYTKKEICDIINKELSRESEHYVLVESDKSHDKCVSIWFDMNCINRTAIAHKIIITNKKGELKAATKEEALEYYNNLFNRALKKLKRAYNVRAKIERDGVGILSLDEEKRKAFFETFIKEQK